MKAAVPFSMAAYIIAIVACIAPLVSGECPTTKEIAIPANFNGDEWPKLYRLTLDPDAPTAPNFSNTVDPKVLAAAGVSYRYIDPTGYDYPVAFKAVPWTPPENGNNDPIVQKLRDEEDYQYADIIVVETFIPKFWDEHLHESTTIRYMLE